MTPVLQFLKENIIFKSTNSKSSKSRKIFETLKPFLIDYLKRLTLDGKQSRTGRPIKTSFDVFFDALYHLLDSGCKITSIPEVFGIPKTTFLRYVRLLVIKNSFHSLYRELLSGTQINKTLLIDSFLVKSSEGREGTGRNPCDRGRQGVKVFVACTEDLVATNVVIKPANTSENNCLRVMIQDTSPDVVTLLGDAGFVGRSIAEESLKSNYRLVAKPRKTRNGQMTHQLSCQDRQAIERVRPKVEHLNARLRRFRGIHVKTVKRLSTYISLIYFGLILISAFQILSKS